MREEPDAIVGARDLRVLIANERPERLAIVTEILTRMGHVVVAAGVDLDEIGETTRREHPDVALVALGESGEHALEMISKIVHEAACPVIALLHSKDPGFVDAAGTRGVFAHITDDDPEQLQSTLDIVLKRFAEYHNLEGAFGRRATIERAKGILMATHAIDEQQAFELLRKHSQRSGQRLFDLAQAVTESHRLLAVVPPHTDRTPGPDRTT
jgi:two-component system, response regulator / RNA-binding antiterminator